MKFFRNFWFGIQNLVLWFPVIWYDRQWDHYYFFNVLRFKLMLMERFFRKDACYVGALGDAASMKECCDLLDRLIADDYTSMAHDAHDQKWGYTEINIDENDKVVIKHPNDLTEEDKKLERKEFLACCEAERDLEKEDVEELFNIMQKNVLLWWD